MIKNKEGNPYFAISLGTIFLLCLCVFIIIAMSNKIQGLNNELDYEKNRIDKVFVNASVGKFTFSNITYVQPNYSNEGYARIFPKDEKFVYLECVNSTLKIDSHKIWCEKEKSQ